MIPTKSTTVRSLLAPVVAAKVADDPLSLAIASLAESIAILKGTFAHAPVAIEVAPSPAPHVTIQMPSDRPKKMRFTIHRDRSGRIESIDAENLR